MASGSAVEGAWGGKEVYGYKQAGQQHIRYCIIDNMAVKFTTSYLEDSISLFRQYKKVAERAVERVTDEQLFTVLDPEMNAKERLPACELCEL
jgi:hypothetical protein